MVINSVLLFVLLLQAWQWPLAEVVRVVAPILVVKLMFLAANMMKLIDGGYVPVLIASTMCLLVWSLAARHAARQIKGVGLADFLGQVDRDAGQIATDIGARDCDVLDARP